MKLETILKNEKVSLYLILTGGILIIVFIIPFFWGESFNWSQQIKSDKFGQFGDIIGGLIGSIWALAGVILFYIALTEQRKDFKTNQDALNLQVQALNQQIEEFKLQRDELASSRKIYEEQSKTLYIQQFESSFFSLLNVYLTIKNNLNTLDASKDYFKELYVSLKKNFLITDSPQQHNAKMIDAYIELYNENRGHLSHYFKSFYRILKIIDSAKLDEKEKNSYAKILRSQLTDFEQLMLFYNSLSMYGEKARPLILKYNLLKNIPLFKKPEFDHFKSLQKNLTILFFTDWIVRFIITQVLESYELNFDTDKIEEHCDHFDCIVGIYFNQSIEIKIFCQTDIKKNSISLTDDQFQNFILRLLYDRLIVSTYVDPQKVTIVDYKTTTATNTIFGATITTSENLNLSKE